MDDVVAEVKQRTDIVELIGSFLSLRKAGQNYKALCPFHQEKTPSFMVNPERQIYKCFGCNEAGDAFSFLQKMEGLTFPEALEELAQRAGVELPARRVGAAAVTEHKALKSRLFAINRQATEFYQVILTKTRHGEAAFNYLKSRGLNSETLAERGLGYAPRERTLLMRALVKRGVGEADLEAAGLMVRDENGEMRDRFIDRIIIPLRNPLGEIVGFSGRLLTDRPQAPKYLNSPETPIFHKGEYVYGLELAKQAIRTEKQAIFVEGHLDVILAYQAGTQAIVGTGGTAVTDQQLQILRRLTDQLHLAFDADLAGQKTTQEVAGRALRLGFEVKLIELGSHKDPGEFASKDPEGWVKATQEVAPIIEARLKGLRERLKTLDASARGEAARSLLELIAALKSPVEAATHLSALAEILGVSDQVVNQEMRQFRQGGDRVSRAPEEPQNLSRPRLSLDELLVGLLIRFPSLLKKAPSLPMTDPELLAIIEASKQGITLRPELITRRDILNFTIEELYSGIDEVAAKGEIVAILKRKQARSREAVQVEFANQIRAAETAGDKLKIKALLQELQQALGERPEAPR